MTFTTSTDPTLTDSAATDLAPFFKRYDRRNRLVLGAAMAASLTLSAVIAARLNATGGVGLKAVPVEWGMGVVVGPLLIAGWWTFGELIAWGRRKHNQPDGRHPAGPDDARNGVRLANAGFAFNLALIASQIIQQGLIASLVFGYRIPGDLITRAIMVAMGAVTIYLGNLWPRMPTPRAPERTAAIRMKANRVSGWVMVIFGLLMVLLGVFLPVLFPWLRRHP